MFTYTTGKSENLTVGEIKRVFREMREKYPEPDVWVYGVEVGPFGGPVGLSSSEMTACVASGWVEFDEQAKRWYWALRAQSVLRQRLEAAREVGR